MMELNIYANWAPSTGPKRPTRAPVVSKLEPVSKPKAVSIHEIIEQELVRILEAAGEPGSSVQQTYDGKEAAMKVLFETLNAEECNRLHASLSADNCGIASFQRLTAARRARILESLAVVARRRSRG